MLIFQLAALTFTAAVLCLQYQRQIQNSGLQLRVLPVRTEQMQNILCG